MDELSDHEQQILGELNEQQAQMLVEAEAIGGGPIMRVDVQQRMHPIVRIGATTFLDESDPELSGAQANEDLDGLMAVRAVEPMGKEVYRLTVLGIRLARHLKQRE